MNNSAIEQSVAVFPEVVEEYLDLGVATCVAFNRKGTLLAAGCINGSCVLWDTLSRGVNKELCDKEHSAAITSVCWSKSGRQILTSALDKTLTLWDVSEGRKVATIELHKIAYSVRLHPGSLNPSSALACPLVGAPILLDINSRKQYILPNSADSAHSYARAALLSATATFNKRGDLIYVGNWKGEILIIDTETREVQAVFEVPGHGVIRQLVFSECGKSLLSNSRYGTLRVFENCLPLKEAARALGELVNASGDSAVTENIKFLVGSQCLKLSKEFQETADWETACFSGDSEWVAGAIASKVEHKICIWHRSGQLVKILEGPEEGLIDLSWHPIKSLVASVAMSGKIYIWAFGQDLDFKQIEENGEYVEREDEFDMIPATETEVQITHVDEDEEVDIITIDSEGPYYLPTIPLPDSPKQEEDSSENSNRSQSDRSAPLDEGKGPDKSPEHGVEQTPDSPLGPSSLPDEATKHIKT